jgi:hypothetical protein
MQSLNSRNMKQPFLIALALLLGMSSLGHVSAAAICPHMRGHECCLVKTVRHQHDSGCTHEAMAMDGMVMDDMATVDISTTSSPNVSNNEVLANKFEQLVESCAHCLGHSGLFNAPVSFVSVADQSKKIVWVALPVPAFLVPSPMTPAQSGLPRQHAPPGTSASRHILISVLLI